MRQTLSAASWWIITLLAFSIFINYADRGNLSIAAPVIGSELHLSASQLGILLSAFFWSYTLCVFPAGYLVDRFDVTWVLASGFLLWSAATAMTGVLHGFAALFVARLIIGAGETVAYPAYGNILSRHIPEHHRGTANAFIQAGQAGGTAFSAFVGGVLIAKLGWRAFFVVLGVASLAWLVPWFRWRPRDNRTSQAKSYSLAGILELLRQRPAWATCAGMFAANYLLYLLLTWLPFYLTRERHFSLVTAGEITGVAFLLKGLGALVSGRISDVWISSGARPTLVHNVLLCGPLSLAGGLLVLSVLAATGSSVILLLMATTFAGGAGVHLYAVAQTIAGPKMAGTWTGLMSCVGGSAGVVAPIATGFVVQHTGRFLFAFVITAIVAWSGTLIWLLLIGPIQQVNWAHQGSVAAAPELAL